MAEVWPRVAHLLDAHGICALVTVAEVRGSAPREAGARMVVGPGDEGFTGTIGGGELEWRVLDAARRALAAGERSASLDRYSLGPELAQCCGGSVDVLCEVFDAGQLDAVRALAERENAGPFLTRARIGGRAVDRTPVERRKGANGGGDDASRRRTRTSEICRTVEIVRRRMPEERRSDPVASGEEVEIVERFGARPQEVWLFGAGHVGRSLILALAPLPFAVTWIDERRGQFPPVLPGRVRTLESRNAAAELTAAPSNAAVVVMTHSHPLDLEIVHAALAAERFAYVGLIGSASKRTRFVQRLRNAGLRDDLVDTLVCPIGNPRIRSKEPAAIAAGVAAQLLERLPA